MVCQPKGQNPADWGWKKKESSFWRDSTAYCKKLPRTQQMWLQFYGVPWKLQMLLPWPQLYITAYLRVPGLKKTIFILINKFTFLWPS